MVTLVKLYLPTFNPINGLEKGKNSKSGNDVFRMITLQDRHSLKECQSSPPIAQTAAGYRLRKSVISNGVETVIKSVLSLDRITNTRLWYSVKTAIIRIHRKIRIAYPNQLFWVVTSSFIKSLANVNSLVALVVKL